VLPENRRSPGDPLRKEGIPVPDPNTINSANVLSPQKIIARLLPSPLAGEGEDEGETRHVHPRLNPPVSRGRMMIDVSLFEGDVAVMNRCSENEVPQLINVVEPPLRSSLLDYHESDGM